MSASSLALSCSVISRTTTRPERGMLSNVRLMPLRSLFIQPAPTRLALNPRPAQPVVPIWIETTASWIEQAAQTLGFGLAVEWQRNGKVTAASGRWPGMLVCPKEIEPAALLTAVGDASGYFVVAGEKEDDIASAGKRLGGPLRMPEFPDWINA